MWNEKNWKWKLWFLWIVGCLLLKWNVSYCLNIKIWQIKGMYRLVSFQSWQWTYLTSLTCWSFTEIQAVKVSKETKAKRTLQHHFGHIAAVGAVSPGCWALLLQARMWFPAWSLITFSVLTSTGYLAESVQEEPRVYVRVNNHITYIIYY